MAYDVVSRIIDEMPPERFEQLLVEKLQKAMTPPPEQAGKERTAYDVVNRVIDEMPPERYQEVVSRILGRIPSERAKMLLLDLPEETLQEALKRLPAEKLRAIKESINQIEFHPQT